MENNRFLEIDLMKIMSCLAVIGIHISAMGISAPDSDKTLYAVSLIVNGISNFAVPSFIFLSGLALMMRYTGRPLSYGHFLQKRMNSILVPYLGWSFTYFIVYAVAGYYAVTVANILSVIFLGTGEFHLYFVIILFQLYALFPLLKSAVDRMHPLLTLTAAVSIHLFFAYKVLPFPYMDRIFIPYLIYFVAGMLWGTHYTVMKNWMRKHGPLTGCLYLCAAGLYLFSRFFPEAQLSGLPQLWQLFSLASILMLMTLSTALVAHRNGKSRGAGMMTLSAATFYVYLAHPLFIAGFFKMCNDLGFRDMALLLPLGYLAVTAVSFAGALAYLKYKKLKRA